MSWLSKLLCVLGVHGPNIFDNDPVPRSQRTAPFERTCSFCGKKWYGREVDLKYVRTLGDWKTEKQLRKTGEWRKEE